MRRENWKIGPQGKRPGAKAGFTLVEVIVAAGIGTAVLLVMLMAMLAATRGYDGATRRIDALVEGRAALGALSDDVATMVSLGSDGFGWQESDERFQEIWFMTVKPRDAQEADEALGDVCFVHYFTAVTRDAPFEEAAVSRKLYRQFVNSAELVDNLRSETLPPPEADPEKAEVIAFNVTRFVAQPLVATSGESGNGLRAWTADDGIPDSLEIDFQVVDNDTADLFRGEEDWSLETPLSRQLVAENEESASSLGRNFHLNLNVGNAK